MIAMHREAGILMLITARNCSAIGKVARLLSGASCAPISADNVMSSDAQVKAVAVHIDNM